MNSLENQINKLTNQTVIKYRKCYPFTSAATPEQWSKYGLSIAPHYGDAEGLLRNIKAHWLVFWYAEKHKLQDIETNYFSVLAEAEKESGIEI